MVTIEITTTNAEIWTFHKLETSDNQIIGYYHHMDEQLETRRVFHSGDIWKIEIVGDNND